MKKVLFFTLVYFLFFTGCSRRIYQVAYPTLSDGKYDSEFPYRNCSAELSRISQSVKKLSAIAYYKSYVFDAGSQVTVEDIKQKKYRNRAVKEIFFNNSVIGSATVISHIGSRIALLTCAHIIDFDDTLYTFYSDENRIPSPYLQSVAFKEKQSNFVADFPERGELDLLAVNRQLDLAILGKFFTSTSHLPIPVFDFPLGKAKDLEWGSFVYMMGYPKGYLMVTKGIVSQPNRDESTSFMVDALFNRGFSGGIVLAIKDGVPNFELVGIAGSVSADFEYALVPSEDISRIGYDPRVPYDGDIYLKQNRNINYGITFIVSAESIQSFIRSNLQEFLNQGYDLSELAK
jgi:Trypsin-like peptidase domain